MAAPRSPRARAPAARYPGAIFYTFRRPIAAEGKIFLQPERWLVMPGIARASARLVAREEPGRREGRPVGEARQPRPGAWPYRPHPKKTRAQAAWPTPLILPVPRESNRRHGDFNSPRALSQTAGLHALYLGTAPAPLLFRRFSEAHGASAGCWRGGPRLRPENGRRCAGGLG